MLGFDVLHASFIENAAAIANRFHRGQKRKYTNMPYITHPYAVAEITMVELLRYKPITESNQTELCATICAAYLHDVLEDTVCTKASIESLLILGLNKHIGTVTAPPKSIKEVVEFTQGFAHLIFTHLDVLTNTFPEGTLREDKQKAINERLSEANELTQLIKLADIKHNVTTIMLLAKDFGKVYTKEKLQQVNCMQPTCLTKRLHKEVKDFLLKAQHD